MKVYILSDLHREFGYTIDSFESDADLYILAGDVDVGMKGIQWIKRAFGSKLVIYVLGNHEYYGGSYPKTLHKIKAEAYGSNVHILENEHVEINGVHFHGATLWTDFSLFGNPKVYGILCQQYMSDYRKIRRDPSYSKIRSLDIYQIHQHSMRWLESSLATYQGERNVVITHHAPSIKSIPKKYLEDSVSAAYASDLEAFILKHNPELWIHGHIHEPKDYPIGQTRILSNPHGYIDEPDMGFRKDLVIEL